MVNSFLESSLYQFHMNLQTNVGWVESNETQRSQASVGFHAVLPNLQFCASLKSIGIKADAVA